MPKLFPTKVHGVLDYATALVLLLLPRLLGWSAPVTTLLTVMAVTVTLYSLVTRYELSVAKLLPMPGHLILDAVSGLGLIAAAFLVPTNGNGEVVGLVVLGLFELGAALLTETHPRGAAVAADSSKGIYDNPGQ